MPLSSVVVRSSLKKKVKLEKIQCCKNFWSPFLISGETIYIETFGPLGTFIHKMRIKTKV